MKLLDKLKNALFEEEYIEVEEKPERVSKEKTKKNDIIKNNRLNDIKFTNYEDVDEEPVARKIAPVKKNDKINRSDLPKREEFKFPKIDDNEFEDNNPVKVTEIIEEKKPVIFNQENYSKETFEQPVYNHEVKKEADISLYKTSKEDEYIKKSTANEYGNYEKTREKKVFKPSPNISPIYGIIDDNGGSIHEPIKKEVRLTSAIRNDRVDVDDVRRKAYGTLADDLNSSLSDSNDNDIAELKENLLIDLRENDAPEVNKVTVADAEEYFEDLGLEYDNDYIDASKAKANGRRLKSDENYESPKLEENSNDDTSFVIEDSQEENNSIIINDSSNEENDNNDSDTEDDDNLFDLIDSMYDNK